MDGSTTSDSDNEVQGTTTEHEAEPQSESAVPSMQARHVLPVMFLCQLSWLEILLPRNCCLHGRLCVNAVKIFYATMHTTRSACLIFTGR